MAIHVRGRNGWFAYNNHYVFTFGDKVSVSIFSKAGGRTAPVIVEGAIAEVEVLFENILKEIKIQKKEGGLSNGQESQRNYQRV